MNQYHIPVMLKEAIEYLNVKRGCWYIDANLGGGGHTKGILQAGGKVLGIDLDPDAIAKVAKNHNLKVEKVEDFLQVKSANLILIQSNFIHLKEIVKKFNPGPIVGILFDLGVSSYQLEKPERGFSFNIDAPLDMRMDPLHTKITAKDLVNGLYENELAEIFSKYGEERFAKPIAKKIVEYRKIKKIETTNQLAQIVLSVRRRGKGDRTHPATRIFQALRIAVNDELNNLQEALPQALDILQPKGRLVAISFHSLEDRIVKNFFKAKEKMRILKILTPKPLTPTEEEIKANIRSRSGKLRAAEKLV